MKKGILVLICSFLFSLITKAQYSPITLFTSSYSSFNQGYYYSPGSTSYNFSFRVGKNGNEIEMAKDGSNLRQYIKVCPDAVVNLNKYLKYRNINKRSKVGIVLSGVALLPGVIFLINGIAKPSIPLTAVGATFLVGGTFGLIFCNARNKKSASKAQEPLYDAVSSYNMYIIDNKLSTESEN
jgi:hypothetical protein